MFSAHASSQPAPAGNAVKRTRRDRDLVQLLPWKARRFRASRRSNQPSAHAATTCPDFIPDLHKWATKLSPAVPGDLTLDCFELARDIRTLDMQASPYDVSSLGETPVAIETADGRAEYVTRQRCFAERSAVLRGRLLRVCDALLA